MKTYYIRYFSPITNMIETTIIMAKNKQQAILDFKQQFGGMCPIKSIREAK